MRMSKPHLLTSTRTGVWPELRLVPVRRPPRRSRSMHFVTVTYTRRTTRGPAWTTWPEKDRPRGMMRPWDKASRSLGFWKISALKEYQVNGKIFRKFVCFFCVCDSGICPNFQNDVCHHEFILPFKFASRVKKPIFSSCIFWVNAYVSLCS